ncbi:sterol carrier family protein [Pseudonocardia spinosispora]|uniref:sterol carrier family protein n=1 Tax=Pseudonocardia spinosispora TaxID=103441 RepID=UPI0004002D7D|nr:sterol carrier family protein [Pseudonocardia spinosispora]
MARTRTIDAIDVRTALAPVRDWLDAPDEANGPTSAGAAGTPDRTTLAAAVRTTLRAFAQRHPGKAVEVRVPPFAAVQCLPGGAHTRGTPPHVVEMTPKVWLRLVTGRVDWDAAVADASVQASGHRSAEIGELLPMPIATDSGAT